MPALLPAPRWRWRAAAAGTGRQARVGIEGQQSQQQLGSVCLPSLPRLCPLRTHLPAAGYAYVCAQFFRAEEVQAELPVLGRDGGNVRAVAVGPRLHVWTSRPPFHTRPPATKL